MSDDERHFGFLAADLSRMMRTEFDRRVAALDITRAQWTVLARLARKPGCTQTELADMMEVERATAGRLLDRLEENGMVRREADPGDRRVRRVFPTAQAERHQTKLRQIADDLIDEALVDLSDAERDQLTGLMATVRARLSGMVQAGSNSQERSASLEPVAAAE